MKGYASIDPIVMAWAAARGLHVYTGHAQNIVRSVAIYAWMGPRHESMGHIFIDPANEMGLVGLHATAGPFQIDEAVSLQDLGQALDRMYEQLAAMKARETSDTIKA